MIRLTRKEKFLTVALAIFAALWLLFNFAVEPARERIKTLNRLIPEKQNELEKLCARSKEYIFLRDGLGRLRTKIASQQDNFELLPFLEGLVRQSGLEEKVASMKQNILPLETEYCQTIVEVRFQGLTLSQLVDFLCKVESSQLPVKTKTLHIKKSPTNAELLDPVVEIHNARLSRGRVALDMAF